VSSNWGTPSRNLRFIYKTKSKQGTNERNLVEGLCKESTECLSKEEQRTLAAGATTSRDLDDFQKKVVGFLCILIIFAYDAYS